MTLSPDESCYQFPMTLIMAQESIASPDSHERMHFIDELFETVANNGR